MRTLGRVGPRCVLADLSVLVAVRVRGNAVLMVDVLVISRRMDVLRQRRRPQGDQRAQQQARSGSMHVVSVHG